MVDGDCGGSIPLSFAIRFRILIDATPQVELPMEDKLRNIEETEAAKKKILEERRMGISRGAFVVDTTSDKGYSRVDGKKKDKRRKKDVASLLLTTALCDPWC